MVVTHTDHKAVVAENDMEARMRDGTILRADVYHPRDDGKYPVLVCRTPYNKLTPRYIEVARKLATRGYVSVVQDHRGRYASDGEYRWMFRDKSETFDAEDGYDTIEWAAKLPWSDGRVGTWGHSNASWAIWMLISTQPPSLSAVLASGISQNLLDLNFGIFETGRRLQWTYMQAADVRLRKGGLDGPLTPGQANQWWDNVERGKYIWWLPLGDIPADAFSDLNDQLQAYHRAQNQEFMNFGEFHSKVTTPVFQITGWWDRLIGTLDNFEGITKNGPEHLRGDHRIVVGPWGHDATDYSRKIGPVDHGPDADATYDGLIGRWYDYQFKGIHNGMAEEDPVQLFILGEDKWRGEKEWPLSRTQYTPFYLHSGGGANTVWGDGLLSPLPLGEGQGHGSAASPSPLAGEAWGEGDAPFDEYLYDPRDPVMSLMRADSQAAPVDQKPHDHRKDILVYQTPPLEEAIEVTGPIHLKLWAQTDGPDTDWTAKLAVVYEDGLAVNLTYGILRAQYRNGYENPTLLEPDEIYEYTIKLNPTGILFKKGQQIRLYVSSSDFPNFDRNHNTGKPYWSDPALRVARQRVYHDAARPSHLVLPVIPRSP